MVTLLVRSWNKRDFVELLMSLNCQSGAEVGVMNGDLSKTLMKAMPQCKLYLIDPWKQQPKEEYPDVSNLPDNVQQARYELVKQIVQFLGNGIILRKKSREAIADIPDNSLDFVYIDANHEHEEIKFDIENWTKKVRPGGVIAGHDYSFYHPCVIDVVLHYCDNKDISPLWIYSRDDIWLFRK